MHIIDLYCY